MLDLLPSLRQTGGLLLNVYILGLESVSDTGFSAFSIQLTTYSLIRASPVSLIILKQLVTSGSMISPVSRVMRIWLFSLKGLMIFSPITRLRRTSNWRMNFSCSAMELSGCSFTGSHGVIYTFKLILKLFYSSEDAWPRDLHDILIFCLAIEAFRSTLLLKELNTVLLVLVQSHHTEFGPASLNHK